jgi:hypothetical protein
MPQIYIMAVLTLGLAAVLYGGLLYAMTGQQSRWLWLLLPGLPLSVLANLLVKKPLIQWVGWAADIPPGLGAASPSWFILFVWLITPIVEELVKVVPLLVPAIRKLVSGREAALWVGFALGLSFGLGEAVFLGYRVAQAPEYANLPWYAFTGYLNERLLVCLLHGLMTAVFVAGVQQDPRWSLLGYSAAVSAHLLANTGAVLFQLGLAPAWVANLSLIAATILLGVIFERLRRRAHKDLNQSDRESETVYYHRAKSIERQEEET